MTLPLDIVDGQVAFSPLGQHDDIRLDLREVVHTAIRMSGVIPDVEILSTVHFTDLPPIFTEHAFNGLFPAHFYVDGYGTGRVGWFYWIENCRGEFGAHAGYNLKLKADLRMAGVASIKDLDKGNYESSRDYIEFASRAMLITLQDKDFKFAVRGRNTEILPTNDSRWRYSWEPIGEQYFYQCHARYGVEFDLFADRVL